MRPNYSRSLREGDRAALLAMRPQTSEEPQEQPAIPNSENIRLESAKIKDYAHQLGVYYETLLPKNGALQEAFSKTITEAAGIFENAQVDLTKSIRVLEQAAATDEIRLQRIKNHQVIFSTALSELRLLTEVDRLLAAGDFQHLEIQSIEQDHSSILMRANLQGIVLREGVFAHTAVWRFDPTGIRLEVSYFDPKTQKEEAVQARLDFHYLGDEKRAALDLEGYYITQAFKVLGKGYHRSKFFEEGKVIKDQEEFIQLKTARLKDIKQVVAKHYGEKMTAVIPD